MKISITAATLLLGTMYVQAADDVASAFKEGKLEGRIRAHYMMTDWDHNDEWNKGVTDPTKLRPDGDSQGMAIGGSLIYKTAPLHGISVGTGFYTTRAVSSATDDNNGVTAGHPKNTTTSDLFARGPGAKTEFGRGYTVMAQSYMQLEIAKTTAKGGRFLMTNPFINPNDTKMIPIAIEGYEAVSNDISNTTIQLDYADKIKERGMDYFASMADTGDTPDAIKNYYNTHYSVTDPITSNDQLLYGKNSTPGVAIAGIKNKSITDLELQGWYMNWPDIIDQVMAEANYKIKAGDLSLTFGARYMQQFDHGAGDIIRPMDGTSPYATGAVTATAPAGGTSKVQIKGDIDNSVDTYMVALRAVANYKAARFMVAYSHTDDGADLIAPWRGFPTEGYTRSMTVTDWNANTTAYKGQFDYDFNSMIPGLSALLAYSFYDRDTSKVAYQGQTNRYYGNGDTRQWNFDVKYAVASMKGLELKVRTMIQENDVVQNIPGNDGKPSEGIGNDTSNKELRAEVNYLF